MTSAIDAGVPLPFLCDSGITSWTITSSIAPAAPASAIGSRPAEIPIRATPKAAATGSIRPETTPMPTAASREHPTVRSASATPAITAAYTRTSPANGCSEIFTDLRGKIAIIDRGACTFTTKIRNEQNALINVIQDYDPAMVFTNGDKVRILYFDDGVRVDKTY